MNKIKMKSVMVSGSFDPIHLGHLLSFKEAIKLGDRLIVVVDSDIYTKSKKGAVFMPILDRVKILKEFRCVDRVLVSKKKDIADVILKIRPDILAKGGDVISEEFFDPEELLACQEVGCKIVFGVGGDKIRSSSTLLNDWVKTSRVK